MISNLHVWLLASAALAACTSQAVIGVVDDDEPAPGGAGASAVAGASSQAGGPSSQGGADSSLESYSEPFRGQFHFSPPSGWMNDIDGLWFADGVFHLSYQANPYALVGGANLHWAHATSANLLHWQQQPLMLVPDENVEGEAWSGSVVVDTENTSGFGRGAAVAIYTSTTLGTSLAYSNDRGQSWQAYDGNPVAIGTADYRTNRDPTVFWHAPSEHWVCAYWENGTTFYTSPDLKTWTRASNIVFGDLVPDFYELPLDGDAKDTRWVLQNADGAYLVGQFDGQSFTPTAGDSLDMDVGPDFFASHTFFRPTFPDRRVVQIGWMKDGGVATAPFRGSATFPVELGLKTFADGVKVTRTPIGELTTLYGATKHWSTQTLPRGKNLLSGIRSKTFDFELVVEAAEAGTLTFRVANKTFEYDFAQQTLLGSALAPLDGQIKFRFLVDWGSLEVFANDGELSYTESVAFTPSDASISVSADVAVALVSADFREIARTWTGAAERDAQIVDDAAPDVTYDGAWNTVSDDATFFGDTCHYSTSEGAALEVAFTGTRVDWYGLRNTDLGRADVLLDGTVVAEAVDCYATMRAPARLFSISDLPDTFHTLRIVARTDKNPSSSGTALVHDYFVSSTRD